MSLDLYPDLEQRSEEWHEARRGIVTASIVGSLIATATPDALDVGCPACSAPKGRPCISLALRGGTPIKIPHAPRSTKASVKLPLTYVPADNDTSRALTLSLVAERVSGFTEDSYINADMYRGIESEPFARAAYNDSRDHEAIEYGLMVRREKDWTLGLSPDGVVGSEGLIEIKCPRAKTHVATILADEVPAHYMPQCQAALLVSGRKWLDFVSYVGGLPLYVKRVFPDPKWQTAIIAAATQFETNAAQMVDAYLTASADMPKTERPAYLTLELKL